MSIMDQCRKPVRIRLYFEEPGMLSKAQVIQGLAKSWFLVHEDAWSIGELALRIEREYRLGGSCPQGLVLEMRGFVLPPVLPARILQDSDLVRVSRKHEHVMRVQSRELLTNSLSVDNEEIDHACRLGRGGLIAIDEFEKEAGGYHRELSDDGDAELSLRSDEWKRLGAQESSGKKRKRTLHIDSQKQNDLPVPTSKPRMCLGGIDSEPSKIKKQKSSGKKKHDKVARGDHRDSQLVALELNVLEGLPRSEHIDDGVSAKSEKKKKKKKKLRELVEHIEPNVNFAGTSSPIEANEQEATPGKRRKVKSVEEAANLERLEEVESGSQKLKPESSRKREKSKKRQDTNHDNHEIELLKEKRNELKGNNGSSFNNEKASEQVNTAEERPSRSARRKKARRRWLRELEQNGVVIKKDGVKPQQLKQTELKDRTDSSESDTSEDETEAKAEAEAEAEEEILPRMCAPGHIRFDYVDDAGDEGRCAAVSLLSSVERDSEENFMNRSVVNPFLRTQKPVLISYTEVRCKKQGQAWGQEKSRGRYSEDGHNRSGTTKNRHSEDTMEQSPSADFVENIIDSEKLPLLSRIPLIGDVLTYKLVELTASWTPELSSYRVGKVSMYDGRSKMISLAQVPEYPIHAQHPEVEDGSLNEDVFLPPYTSDGTLEADFATLMEVRVLEEGAVQVNLPSLESTDVIATTIDVPTKSSQFTTVSQEPVEPTVNVELNAASSADKTHSDPAELDAAGDGGERTGLSLTMQSEPVLNQTTSADWQDMLSQEINNKKLELSLRAGKELEAQNCDGPAPADGVQKSTSQVIVAENGKRNLRVSAPPIIRHRYLRTGALGPTMALLRASQIL